MSPSISGRLHWLVLDPLSITNRPSVHKASVHAYVVRIHVRGLGNVVQQVSPYFYGSRAPELSSLVMLRPYGCRHVSRLLGHHSVTTALRHVWPKPRLPGMGCNVISCQRLTAVIGSLSYTPSLFHSTQRTGFDFGLI
jgi:hypothetical protein